jgi:hypothetical protein
MLSSQICALSLHLHNIALLNCWRLVIYNNNNIQEAKTLWWVSVRQIDFICKQNKGMGPLTEQQALLFINGSKEATKGTLSHVLVPAQMCYVLYVQLLLT